MDISGLWYNELNSTVYLRVNGKTVTGWYISAVGAASGPYELIGFLDRTDETPTLGWTVAWQNQNQQAHSVTTWCGQAQIIDQEQQIDTTWLLVRSTSVAEDWEATMVSKDLFRRVKSSPAAVQRAMKLRGVKEIRTISDEELPADARRK
jgi:avidin family protein